MTDDEMTQRVFSKSDLKKWHKFTDHNRDLIAKSQLVGCFYCGDFSAALNVTHWIDGGTTGMCPQCDIDSLIPDAALPTLSIWHLRAMYDVWFGIAHGTSLGVDDTLVIDKDKEYFHPRSW